MPFRIKIIMMILFCLPAESGYSQDINFSQFYEIPMMRNPSLAGIFEGDIRITASYRNQWQSVTTPYRTQALGVEFKTSLGENNYDFITLGLQLSHDEAGDSKLSKTQILPVLNFHKLLNGDKDSYLSAGVMAGAAQQRFDPFKLKFDDQYLNGAFSTSNPTQQLFTNTNITYWDIAAGLSFSSVTNNDIHYYAGIGLFHFTKPKVAFISANEIKLNPKWSVNVGLSAPTGDNDRLLLYGDYFLQGGTQLVQGGFLYSHDLLSYDDGEKTAVSIGSFYRWGDAIIPVVKLEYFNWGIGMSYDVNVSKLKTASQTRGGFEVNLSYTSYLNILNTSLNKVRCVQF